MNYHDDHSAFSKSFLTYFLKSPLAAKTFLDGERKDTAAMNFGRAYHSIVAGFEDYKVYDESERPNQKFGMAAQANVAWLEEMKKECETCISKTEFEQILDMKVKLMENEITNKIIGLKHLKEVAYKATIDGVNYKCKPDAIVMESALIVDWKTIDSVDEWNVRKNIRNYHYDMQVALYCDILKEQTGIAHNFLFVFQEKEKPYDVLPVLVRHTSETYMSGRVKYKECGAAAKKAFETGIWPGAASKYNDNMLEL